MLGKSIPIMVRLLKIGKFFLQCSGKVSLSPSFPEGLAQYLPYGLGNLFSGALDPKHIVDAHGGNSLLMLVPIQPDAYLGAHPLHVL